MFARTFRQASQRFSSHHQQSIRRGARAFASTGGGGGSGSGGAAMPLALLALGGVGYVYYDNTEKISILENKTKELQIQLSGKTNSAFVFIKPHACKGSKPGSVEQVLEDTLKENGIRITNKGTILAETIDKNMYIDTHYGAIASKAVKLKPSELNVPDKGKQQFEQMFGESWDAAIAAGKVYNAKDAATKLNIDSDGLNTKWSKLTRGKDLIKFGGGFYCGKVDGIYVMNGFYMAMRAGMFVLFEKISVYCL